MGAARLLRRVPAGVSPTVTMVRRPHDSRQDAGPTVELGARGLFLQEFFSA